MDSLASSNQAITKSIAKTVALMGADGRILVHDQESVHVC